MLRVIEPILTVDIAPQAHCRRPLSGGDQDVVERRSFYPARKLPGPTAASRVSIDPALAASASSRASSRAVLRSSEAIHWK